MHFANGGDRKVDNVPEVEVCKDVGVEMLWGVGGGKIQSSSDLMSDNNPLIIPRNYKVEEALNDATTNGNLTQIHNFLKVLKNPYKDHFEIANYQSSPPPSDKIYKTFCGT